MNVKITDVVKKFKGGSDEDIVMWLDRITVAVDLIDASSLLGKTQAEKDKEIAKLIPLFLEEAAYSTWKQIPSVDRENLTVVKAALIRVFGKSKLTAWRELREKRLFPGDSVDAMAEEIKSLLSVVTSGVGPNALVSLFLIESLPKTIADQVLMQHGQDLEIHKIVESSKSLMSAAQDSSLSAATGLRREPEPLRSNSAIKRCRGCGRSGHLQRDCMVVCYRCQGRGHIQRNCPNTSGNDKAVDGRAESPSSARQH